MRVSDLQMNARIQPLEPKKTIVPKQELPGKSGKIQNFSEVLQEKLKTNQGVNFSAHAMSRIEQRNLNISMEELSRLDNGLQKLEDKGSQNSLVLVDDTAYIVSVKNRIVVTALDKTEAVNNVYTNIDSVAIV